MFSRAAEQRTRQAVGVPWGREAVVRSSGLAPPPWGVRGLHGRSWAFWGAFHGGQPVVADVLLERGADINWVAPWDRPTQLDAARRSEHSTMI